MQARGQFDAVTVTVSQGRAKQQWTAHGNKCNGFAHHRTSLSPICLSVMWSPTSCSFPRLTNQGCNLQEAGRAKIPKPATLAPSRCPLPCHRRSPVQSTGAEVELTSQLKANLPPPPHKRGERTSDSQLLLSHSRSTKVAVTVRERERECRVQGFSATQARHSGFRKEAGGAESRGIWKGTAPPEEEQSSGGGRASKRKQPSAENKHRMQPGGTPSTRRRLSVPRSNAAAAAASSSVWETRMKMDEVKGGVKVFSAGGDDADEEGLRVYRRLRRNQSEGGAGAAAAAKKRRNWKASEPVTAIGELRKSRSDAATAAVVARRAVARVSTPEKKVAAAASGEVKEVVVVEVEKAPLVESKNFEEETEDEDEEEEGEFEEELDAEEVEEKEVLDQDHMAIDEEHSVNSTAQVDDQDLEPPTKRGMKPAATPMEHETAANPEPVKPPPEKKLVAVVDLRAMNPEPMTTPTPSVEKMQTPVMIHRMANTDPAKPSPEKKVLPTIGRRIPKQEPVNTTPVEEEYEEIQGRPSAPSRSDGRMQNIVDLVMWRDVSKSALVFGLGTFLLISSSYAKDLNFNTITAASYLGLVYLGLRFLCKSILNRGENVHCDDEKDSNERYLLGEEEAIWLLRLVLPYANEVLLNLRSLFSGEPATTMKLALLLFAMARCGSFVTLWTLAKLVFFGVFIIPKVCSSYSTQLARYGKFWLERFRDAWESCSHKKAVVAAIFTLVWNVSSTVARVWAVFMLVVAMKCYQQRMMEYGWSSTVEEPSEDDDADGSTHGEEAPAKPAPAKAHDHDAAAGPRHRRAPFSGEFARERLRVRGGIQPR